MLSSLSLNNVALIKKQSVEFQRGFNCLLGKSGAGKSIIIDALAFCLGAKADKNLIRSGEQSLRVDAVFCDLGQEVLNFLKEQEIEETDELIITRTLNVDGKSSVKINGFPISLKTLQALSEILVDFCGQHESVGLLNPANHLLFLDKFGGSEIEKLKVDVAQNYERLQSLKSQIAAIGGDESERERTKDLLKFQIQEITDANLDLCEEDELREQLDFISSAEKIFENVGAVVVQLDEQSGNAASLLYQAKNELNCISNFKSIEECRSRIENCYYEVKDIAETLNSIKDSTDYDERKLERITSRLDQIRALKKKYGKTVEQVLDFLADCQKRLETLENSEIELEKLSSQMEQTDAELKLSCKKLSDKRKYFAKIFEKNIMMQLDELEMKGTQFVVDFQPSSCRKNGCDEVKFMFSANKGQELKDLHKTASGGELSRLLLAFKNTMLGQERVQTIVFDEIDAGISGHTAGKLAEKIANISKYTQVLCITHTPVVASRANAFVLVEKNVVDGSTVSTAKTLEKKEAVVEVAKLIDGGSEVSNTAILHSKKLFEE
jgi:DNA repair protein RecN (Recombination protein N)